MPPGIRISARRSSSSTPGTARPHGAAGARRVWWRTAGRCGGPLGGSRFAGSAGRDATVGSDKLSGRDTSGQLRLECGVQHAQPAEDSPVRPLCSLDTAARAGGGRGERAALEGPWWCRTCDRLTGRCSTPSADRVTDEVGEGHLSLNLRDLLRSVARVQTCCRNGHRRQEAGGRRQEAALQLRQHRHPDQIRSLTTSLGRGEPRAGHRHDQEGHVWAARCGSTTIRADVA